MTKVDNRRHSRVKSLNLLSYVCVDENQNAVRQGMGRTLDICEGGILLETHVPIDLQHTLLLSIGLQDAVTDIAGRVVYCRGGRLGKFESGIDFQRKDESEVSILKKHLRVLREQRKETPAITE